MKAGVWPMDFVYQTKADNPFIPCGHIYLNQNILGCSVTSSICENIWMGLFSFLQDLVKVRPRLWYDVVEKNDDHDYPLSLIKVMFLP